MSDTFGFDDFMDALGELEEDFINASEKLLKQTGDLAVAEIQARTPVGVGTPNPGNLRRSMGRGDVEKIGKDMTVEVGTDVEYAEPVEEGHKTKNGGFVKGRHMFKSGIAVAQKRFDDKAESLFDETVSKFKL